MQAKKRDLWEVKGYSRFSGGTFKRRIRASSYENAIQTAKSHGKRLAVTSCVLVEENQAAIQQKCITAYRALRAVGAIYLSRQVAEPASVDTLHASCNCTGD